MEVIEEKGEKIMPKISLQLTNQKGFTLIEVLIAVFIAVSTLTFILPQIKRTENQTKNNLRDLQSLNRTLYSYSRIYNKKYRLVLESGEDFSSYWVESEISKPFIVEELEDSSQDPPHPFFEKDPSLIQTKRFLPGDLSFEWDEEIQNNDENIFYVLYDPHAFSPPFYRSEFENKILIFFGSSSLTPLLENLRFFKMNFKKHSFLYQRGFTFIEVMYSVLITATTLVMLSNLSTQTNTHMKRSDRYSNCFGTYGT